MDESDVSRREQAYLIWSTDGEQDDAKTAELSGIPRRTVSYYRVEDGWRQRLLSAIAPDAEATANLARRNMSYIISRGLERMDDIVNRKKPVRNANGEYQRHDDGSLILVWASEDKDAINAMKLLSLYAIGVADGSQATEAGAYDMRPANLRRGPTNTPRGLTAQEQATHILEATVQSVNTRKKQGRRV